MEPKIGLVAMAGKALIGKDSHLIEIAVSKLIEEGCQSVVLDMTALTHMDSTGMGQIISSLTKLMGIGGKMVAFGAAPGVREGFRVTRLDTVIRFVDDREAAISAVR